MPAALNAFGTCSSSATIPLSKVVWKMNWAYRIRYPVSQSPLGATVNMDAVSILMSFMIMFFANACGVHVSIPMMIIILLANVLLSVGTPGIPGGATHRLRHWQQWQVFRPESRVCISVSIHYVTWEQTCVNVIGDMAGCVVLRKRR